MSPTQSTAQIQPHTLIREPQSNNGFLTHRKNVKVRKFVNSAIYIEKTFDMNCNQTIYFPGSGDHPKTVTVKRCSCLSNPDDCPCHPSPPKEELSQAEAEGYGVPPRLNKEETFIVNKLCSSSSATKLNLSDRVFESDSGITVKASNSTSELRLSLPSNSSLDTLCPQGGVDYREWCRRKDYEKRMQEEREQMIQKIKEQQKQAVFELERENFKRWLANKKKKEEETKRLKQQQEEEARRKEEEKSKRLKDNERNFQMWLRKKEQRDLEKRIEKQLALIEREEEKERRLEVNQRAYEFWREHAKNRQKPVPFGLGLDTLKSSASVSYINPQPWVPNIDPTAKPHSQ